MAKFDVFVTAKPGIYDPAGVAAKSTLADLGFAGVERVSIGKFIRVEGDVTAEQVAEMCDRLLVNPVIEDYRVEISEED